MHLFLIGFSPVFSEYCSPQHKRSHAALGENCCDKDFSSMYLLFIGFSQLFAISVHMLGENCYEKDVFGFAWLFSTVHLFHKRSPAVVRKISTMNSVERL